MPACVSSWTGAAYEAAEVAEREAKHQETLRFAAEALDRSDKRRKKKKKRRKKKLPKTSSSRSPCSSSTMAVVCASLVTLVQFFTSCVPFV